MSEEVKFELPKEGAVTLDSVKDAIVVTKTEETKEDPQLTDIEKRALNRGWKPKDQFYGKEDDFIEAEDFVKNFTWVREINKLKDTIDRQKKTLESLVDHNKKVEEVTYKKAKQELESKLVGLDKQLEDAALLGDTNAVKNINKEIVDIKIKETFTQPLPVVNNIPDYVTDFNNRNKSWFNNNSAMTAAMSAYALKIDKDMNGQNPDMDPVDHLKLVEEKVKKEFPQYFATKTHTAAEVVESKHASKVESASSASTRSSDLRIEDLPKEAQDLARRLKSSTKKFDEQTYIKQYRLINGV